jgi:hypothetical protein
MMNFDPKVWKQVSNKYRLVARMPEGKTALEALAEANPELHAVVMKRAEQWAHDDYLRFCAEKHGLQKELSVEEWAEYKKARQKLEYGDAS